MVTGMILAEHDRVSHLRPIRETGSPRATGTLTTAFMRRPTFLNK